MSHATKVVNVSGIPNRFDSRIADLEKLNKVRSGIASYNLLQRIGQQKNLGNLEDLYKPLIKGQEKQLDATKTTNTKLDEVTTNIADVLERLVVNGRLSTESADRIINKITRSDRELLTVLDQILKMVDKKPEALELIKALEKYPNAVKSIKGEIDPAQLTKEDLRILTKLDTLDDTTLKVLVDYYTKVKPEFGNIVSESDSEFGDAPSEVLPPTPTEVLPPAPITDDDQIAGGFVYDAITNMANEPLINDKTELGKFLNEPNERSKKNNLELLKKFLVTNKDISLDRSKTPWVQIEKVAPNFVSTVEYARGNIPEDVDKVRQEYNTWGEDIYNLIMKVTLKGDYDELKKYLNTNLPAAGKNNSEVLRDYLVKNKDIDIDARFNPWRQINKFLPNFVDNVREERDRVSKSKSGKGLTKFLSSDPNVLFKRLEVLLAEKKAGNNNVMDEASEIAGELRRKGILSISQLRKVFKQFK